MKEKLALIQGVYYLVTGIWPFVHLQSFLAATGPKTDIWLLKTVATLITVIGIALSWAGFKKDVNQPVFLLGIGSALGLAGIGIFYSVRGTISSVHGLESILELVLALAWFMSRKKDNFRLQN